METSESNQTTKHCHLIDTKQLVRIESFKAGAWWYRSIINMLQHTCPLTTDCQHQLRSDPKQFFQLFVNVVGLLLLFCFHALTIQHCSAGLTAWANLLLLTQWHLGSHGKTKLHRLRLRWYVDVCYLLITHKALSIFRWLSFLCVFWQPSYWKFRW